MSIRLTLAIPRLALFGLLVLALVAAGLAHRAPSQQQAALQTTWMMAGGSWDGICGDVVPDGQPARVKCPACQLTGAAGLPPPSATVLDAGLRLLTVLTAPQAEAPPRPVLDPARGSRAPPFA